MFSPLSGRLTERRSSVSGGFELVAVISAGLAQCSGGDQPPKTGAPKSKGRAPRVLRHAVAAQKKFVPRIATPLCQGIPAGFAGYSGMPEHAVAFPAAVPF
jgi:hypothetical protein